MEGERNATVRISPLGEMDAFVLTFLYSLAMSIGLSANLLIALAILRSKRLRKRPQFLLMNVLLCDELNSVIDGPYYIFSATCRRMPQGSDSAVSVCRAYLYLSFSLGFISIFSLMLMSVDRYMAVVKPYVYQNQVTNIRVLTMSIIIWFAPFVLTLPAPLIHGWLAVASFPDELCGLQWSRISKEYTATLIALCFVAPTVVIFFTNIHVFLVAHRQKRFVQASQRQGAANKVFGRTDSGFEEERTNPVEVSRRCSATGHSLSRIVPFNNMRRALKQPVLVSSQDVQIAVATLLLVMCYMLTWLPFVAWQLMKAFRSGLIWRRLGNYSTAVAFSRVAWNPLLILGYRNEIRRAVKLMFCRGNIVSEVLPKRE